MPLPHDRPGFLFVIPWDLSHVGGVNQVVRSLYRQAQRSARWAPMLFVSKWRCRQLEYQDVENRPTVSFRLRSPWVKDRPLIALATFLLYLPSSLRSLRKMLAEHKISIVNVHYPGLSSMAFTLLRALGGFQGRVVVSFHGTDIAEASATTGVERWMWRALLRSADALVSCSAALKQAIVTLAPDCEHKITVIHNGLDVEWFRAQRDSGFVLNDGLANRSYILSVGTFLHVKGQDVLLEAFHLLASEFPDLALVLVGGEGPTLPELKELARRRGLEDRVLFYSNMPYSIVPAFYEKARVFCLPSRREAFALVLLEAGAHGLPVVATQVGGAAEFISNGEDGRLVPSDDPLALTRALRQVLLDEQAARAMGQRLRSKTIEQFTWVRSFDQYEQVAE
jgi:glycosyltransferase involved in cell wall biosynthesis